MGLSDFTQAFGASLSHGYKKPLEMAIALTFGAELFLLDEPTSGLSSEEAKKMIGLLENLSQKGATIIIVEHNMDVVFSLAKKISVLHFGRIIAEGGPEEIKKNDEVIKAYLGEE